MNWPKGCLWATIFESAETAHLILLCYFGDAIGWVVSAEKRLSLEIAPWIDPSHWQHLKSFSCESSWNQDNTYGLNIIIMQFKSLPLFLILCTYEIDLEHPFFLIGQNWLSAFLSKTSGQSQNLYSIWKRL